MSDPFLLVTILLALLIGILFGALRYFTRYRTAVGSTRATTLNRPPAQPTSKSPRENERSSLQQHWQLQAEVTASEAKLERWNETAEEFENLPLEVAASVEFLLRYLAKQPATAKIPLFALCRQGEASNFEYLGPDQMPLRKFAVDCRELVDELVAEHRTKLSGLERLCDQGCTLFLEQDARLSGLVFLGYSGIYLRGIALGSQLFAVIVACISRSGEVDSLQRCMRVELDTHSAHIFFSQVHALAATKAAQQMGAMADRDRELAGLLHDMKASTERLLSMDSAGQPTEISSAMMRTAELVELSELQSMAMQTVHEQKALFQPMVAVRTAEVVLPLVERLGLVARRHKKAIAVIGELHSAVGVAPQILRRVLSNYIMNAIRYSDSPMIKVEIIPSESHVKCRVIDEGPGLRGASQGALGTLENQPKNIGGFGIGLKSCERLVESSGGYTWFSPNGATGTIFGVAFPRVPVPNSASDRISQLSVLVLDDDLMVRKNHVRLLKNSVCRVLEAGTLGEATDILKREKVDCVLADFHLEGQTLVEITALTTAETPVIVCSGGLSSSEFAELGVLGRFLYLEKPLQRIELLTALEVFASNDGSPPEMSQALGNA